MIAELPPDLPPEPLYLPFEPGPFRMSMGLVACDPDDIIRIDDRYPAELAQRRALLAAWGKEVADAAPGAEPACRELRERLFALLPRRYPAWFTRTAAGLANALTGERWDAADAETLRAVALLVQEDLCLLALRDGAPLLIAGTLCFSPGWRLSAKLGQPLAGVHAPVPLFADRLARPVDRLIATLGDGKLVERMNWGLYTSPALFRPGHRYETAPDPSITPENALERLFLRVERQTLSRLPQTGTVLFSIGTHVYPLRRVLAVAGAGARLREALAGLPPELARYKGMTPFRDAALAALDAAAR